MRIMLDTNILLDYSDRGRQPYHEQCMTMLRACIEREVEILASVSSLKDVYYVLSKRYGNEFAHQSVLGVMALFDVCALPVRFLKEAALDDDPRFENTLVRLTAENEGCDMLITRTDAPFHHTNVPYMTPEEWVKQFG